MSTIRTPWPAHKVNLAQLAAEVGAALSTSDAGIESADPKASLTQAQLAAAVTSHVADPAFGRDDRDRQVIGMRSKAQAVWAGTETFTAAQVQKVLAWLVLRD